VKRWVPAIAAAVAAVSLVATHLALGGSDYRPLEVADPCDPRPQRDVEGIERLAEQIALSALDGAACELRVTREELTLALADPESRERFARDHEIGEQELEELIRSGLRRALDDAARAGRIDGLQLRLLRATIEVAPIAAVIDIVRGARELF
jgi:hypothetical protein